MNNSNERETVNWLCSSLSSLSVLAMIMVNGVTSHAAQTWSINREKGWDWSSASLTYNAKVHHGPIQWTRHSGSALRLAVVVIGTPYEHRWWRHKLCCLNVNYKQEALRLAINYPYAIPHHGQYQWKRLSELSLQLAVVVSVHSMTMIDGVANHAAQTFSTNRKKH